MEERKGRKRKFFFIGGLTREDELAMNYQTILFNYF